MGCGPAEERVLLTGLHAVADIYCENCKTTLGWKYVSSRFLPGLPPLFSPPPRIRYSPHGFSSSERTNWPITAQKSEGDASFFLNKKFPTNTSVAPPPLLDTLYLGPEFELSGLRAREIITVPKGWLQTVGPVPLRVCGD